MAKNDDAKESYINGYPVVVVATDKVFKKEEYIIWDDDDYALGFIDLERMPETLVINGTYYDRRNR